MPEFLITVLSETLGAALVALLVAAARRLLAPASLHPAG
jgi:hypothetical protein